MAVTGVVRAVRVGVCRFVKFSSLDSVIQAIIQ